MRFSLVEKGNPMVEPKNDFDRGAWLMFKSITNVYFEKEYYFLAIDGTVFSRLSSQTLDSKQAAYDEFFRYLHTESYMVDDE